MSDKTSRKKEGENIASKISNNIVVVIISLISSVIGIFVFVTGKNLIDFRENSDSGTKQSILYELTGSVVHFPNISSGDYTIGGVWKLQGIHEAAYSFSQRVEVYSPGSPDNILYYGAASYDMEWCECEDGTFAEIPSDVDQITQYDYPSGTYGTFRVDLYPPSISAGNYECRLVLYINEVCYTYTIPFEI